MKLFKRKQQIKENDDYEYWKDPRLDDEGTYDYLVEKLPSDTARWEWYDKKCDCCGKYHKFNFCSTHYFYCYDGWDSISCAVCWPCDIKNKIHGIKSKIKRKIKTHKEYCALINVFKSRGIEITKEDKNEILSIVSKKIIGG